MPPVKQQVTTTKSVRQEHVLVKLDIISTKDFYIHGPDTLSDVVSVGTGNENEQRIVFDVKMFEIPCFFFAP